MSRRPGRKVLFERPYPEGRNRFLTVPFAPEYAARMMLPEALDVLAVAQRFAEAEARCPVSLELFAAVQHGDPIPMSYTLHFEVTRLEYPPLQETYFGSGIYE